MFEFLAFGLYVYLLFSKAKDPDSSSDSVELMETGSFNQLSEKYEKSEFSDINEQSSSSSSAPHRTLSSFFVKLEKVNL